MVEESRVVNAASEGDFLTLTGISKRYGGVTALENVDFACGRGRIHAVLGENGAGKSTLIKIVAGVVQPDAGTMLVNAKLWIGHFDLWPQDGTIIFRHAMIFPDAEASASQCEALLNLALEACEHYYPAFQFVLWGGKSADEAIASAMIDPIGEA